MRMLVVFGGREVFGRSVAGYLPAGLRELGVVVRHCVPRDHGGRGKTYRAQAGEYQREMSDLATHATASMGSENRRVMMQMTHRFYNVRRIRRDEPLLEP